MSPARDILEPVPDWKPPPAPPPDLVLAGRHVQLEPLGLRHADDLHDANTGDAEGRNWDYLPYGPFDSGQEYRAWVEGACMGTDPHFFAIKRWKTGRFEGVASFLRINPGAGSIEVGHINFSPPLQGSTAGTEAICLMMKWAFQAGYRRFEWKCDAANARSRRAAERLGLSFEGVFRQHMIVKGRNRDTAWFAAIDSQWPDLNAAFDTWLAAANFDAEGSQRQRLWDLTAPIRVSDDPSRGA